MKKEMKDKEKAIKDAQKAKNQKQKDASIAELTKKIVILEKYIKEVRRVYASADQKALNVYLKKELADLTTLKTALEKIKKMKV